MPSSTTPDLAAKAWQGNGWRDEGVHLEPPSPLHADEVRRLAADAAQVPRLRLRGLERHAARRQLRDFVVLARHADIRVIRIVTGKGLGSQGAPVLRPLVGRWLETAQRDGSVRGWHYEVDASGAWGSVLVALRRWKCESL